MKRKFNYKKFIIFCICVLLILAGIIYGIVKVVNHFNYKKTYEYKFTTLGYTLDEYKSLDNKLSNSELDLLLKKEYNLDIIKFINEKYFIFSNLDKYLEYKDYKNDDYANIVKIINTESNIDWFDNEKETDISKNYLMLVNRLYGLNKDYQVETTELSLTYSYGKNYVSTGIYDKLIELITSAKDNGYTFVVSQGYRSYEEQEKIYNSYVSSLGMSEADDIVARPGHSEYQTGLSIELKPYNKVFEDDYESSEYKYLKDNAYKYGFILRFDKGTSKITGFNSSAWRLRYVGVNEAKIIHDENLTFEEYYAYYVNK